MGTMKRQPKINEKMHTSILAGDLQIEGEFKVKVTGDMIQITGNPKNVIMDYREPQSNGE